MEIKEGNKLSFGLGIFFVAVYGVSIVFTGFEIKTSVFFIYGIYLVWQNGFVKDTSKWKVNPIKIILISGAVTFSLLCILYLIRFNNTNNIQSSKKQLIYEIADKANENLPIDLGNGDSIIKIIVINDNILEYEYKLQYSADSINKKELEVAYKELLYERLKSFNKNILSEWSSSKINFRHRFKDRDGKITFVINIKSGEY